MYIVGGGGTAIVCVAGIFVVEVARLATEAATANHSPPFAD